MKTKKLMDQDSPNILITHSFDGYINNFVCSYLSILRVMTQLALASFLPPPEHPCQPVVHQEASAWNERF